MGVEWTLSPETPDRFSSGRPKSMREPPHRKNFRSQLEQETEEYRELHLCLGTPTPHFETDVFSRETSTG